MHLALIVAGVGAGDEVITSPMTFCATANVILHVGAVPVFVDVEHDSFNIDPSRIEAAVTPRTRAILPVHMAGRPCAIDAVAAVAARHGLTVIEDAAHCVEGRVDGRPIGSISPLTSFSFYATKNLTTAEGGMVTTSRADWAEALRRYRLHGLDQDAWKRYGPGAVRHYEAVVPGFKYNLSDLQAAMGLPQLRRLEANLKRREEVWAAYDAAFAGLPVTLPAAPAQGTRHARHLYTLLVDRERAGITRDEFRERLNARGVGTALHFIAVHLQAYYRERFGFKPDDFPVAAWISERTVSLPLSAKLTDGEVERVIEAVRASLR
jgi:dTDP-4-amino-4,6-dideoxygalactose transaminase